MRDIISIYNHNTGEQIVREMTADEQEKREAEITAQLEKKAEEEAAEQNLRQLKISAYEKLGLSVQEIEALLPTPKPPLGL